VYAEQPCYREELNNQKAAHKNKAMDIHQLFRP